MLNLFSLRGLSRGMRADSQQKVVLNAAELASLRSEITDLEDREAQLKAKLEHLDEILRYAQLSGYLYLRRRWATLPGEPPLVDDCEVDDWIPRFLVLHRSCIYLYSSSCDFSPQDSMLLSDDVELGFLPNITQENKEVDSWVAALEVDCELRSEFEDIGSQPQENSI